MDKFQAIQVFVKVADCQSFAGAAREMGMSPPAVTRSVSMLEEALGTRLFVRTTRVTRLTDSGRGFLADSRRILADLQEAEEAAAGSHAEPQGELRITAPVLFGRMYVTPILGEFLQLYPRVQASTLYLDRNVSLIDEAIDVAIRIGELPDSSLTAIRCGTVRPVMFGSPDYFEMHGVPAHPDDLSHHVLVQSTAVAVSNEWNFVENGKPRSIRIEPRIRMNTNDAVIEMVVRGWGVSRLFSYQVAPLIAEGRLRAILEGYELPPLPIHVVHQEGRTVSARTRKFVDFIVERLRADVHLN